VEVSYSYELPYHIGMAVSRTLAVPINSVALIVSSEALAVSGAGLMAAGVMETQMGTATSYTAGPLADGETLAFTFTDRPPSTRDNPAMPGQSRASKQRNPAREIGLGLMILALAGLVGYQFWRTPASAPAPEHIRLLIEAVAKLDAEYEAGTLPEAEYQHKRQALRQRIREQMQAPDVYD